MVSGWVNWLDSGVSEKAEESDGRSYRWGHVNFEVPNGVCL